MSGNDPVSIESYRLRRIGDRATEAPAPGPRAGLSDRQIAHRRRMLAFLSVRLSERRSVVGDRQNRA
jgi:hypothetical protein